MTNDFKYRIVRINCFDGRVSYVNSDVLDDFNYTDISICNNRLYVMKTDEVYCYVSAYDFNGKHLSDYRFSEKNVNAITTNNGSAYVFFMTVPYTDLMKTKPNIARECVIARIFITAVRDFCLTAEDIFIR